MTASRRAWDAGACPARGGVVASARSLRASIVAGAIGLFAIGLQPSAGAHAAPLPSRHATKKPKGKLYFMEVWEEHHTIDLSGVEVELFVRSRTWNYVLPFAFFGSYELLPERELLMREYNSEDRFVRLYRLKRGRHGAYAGFMFGPLEEPTGEEVELFPEKR